MSFKDRVRLRFEKYGLNDSFLSVQAMEANIDGCGWITIASVNIDEDTLHAKMLVFDEFNRFVYDELAIKRIYEEMKKFANGE